MRIPIVVAFAAALAFLAFEARAYPWAQDYAGLWDDFAGVVPLNDGSCFAWASEGELVAVEPGGAIRWQTRLRATHDNQIYEVHAAPAGGLIARCGGAIVRLGEDGALLWATTTSTASIVSLAALPSGEFALAGSIPNGLPDPRDHGGIFRDGWLGILAADGTLSTQRSYRDRAGGLRLDSVSAAPDGGLYVGGSATGPDSVNQADPTSHTPILVRLDSSGSPLWEIDLLPTMVCDADTHGLISTSDGGAMVMSMDYHLMGGWNGGWRRVDRDGRTLMSYSYASEQDECRAPVSAFEAADGSLLVNLGGRCGAILARYDAMGDPEWAMGTAGPGYLGLGVPTLDGGILLAGRGMIASLDAAGQAPGVACLTLPGPIAAPSLRGDLPPADAPVITLTALSTSVVPADITATPGRVSLLDTCDNCPGIPNDQRDTDADGLGDACDNCPGVASLDPADGDGDGLGDACDECTDLDADGLSSIITPATTCPFDLCPLVADPSNANADLDAMGDACDPCPLVADDGSESDRDGVGDACDACPLVADDQSDVDGDGIGDACDGCPGVRDAAQDDADGDGIGDACDDCHDVADPHQDDVDADGVGDVCDGCPRAADASQDDADGDGIGDACDDCGAPDRSQADCDGDGVGEACQPGDADGDGVANDSDRCPCVYDASQRDRDGDSIGDACDPCPNLADLGHDMDGDGLGDLCDNCRQDNNPGQDDSDGDGWGDSCDDCPDIADPLQVDGDADGIGDACDSVFAPSQLDLTPAAPPLRVEKGDPGTLALSWEDVGVERYDVHRGSIEAIRLGAYDHARIGCGVIPAELVVPDAPGSFYFLVIGRDASFESSYGRDSLGRERPRGLRVCP